MKKICLYELGSTHISFKNLLLVISNHLERIELFSSKIDIEMLNFLNQKDILVSLKSIYFSSPINKISECAFTGFNNNLEVSFSKNLNDFIVLKPEHENMTLFGIFHTIFNKNFRKNIILSENFEYSFDSNESNVNIDLDSFKNDEMVKLFYIVSNNNIYIEKTIYFVNECNEKDSFILIYNGIKKSDFEFFKLWDRPIQSIRIYGCFLETDDLFQIIRFKSLKTMHIENSILKNDLKNPIFHDNNIETVFFKSNIIYNLDLFFSFLDSFKLNTRFKLDIKQNSSIGLENLTFSNKIFNAFLLFKDLKNENFAITIEKSNYITLIIQFKILLDKLNNIFSAEVNSQMSTLNLYDCEILKNSRLSLNRFKNLRNLELSASKQEINFYQLFDLAWGQILARIELKNFKIEQRDIIRIFLFKNLVFLKFSNCNFVENIQKCFKRKKGCCLKRLILSFNPEVNYKELSNYLFEEFDNIFSLEIYHPVPPN